MSTSRASMYAPPPTQQQQQQQSTAAPSGPSSRLAAKQAELEGLKQLREYSARLVKELEKMGDGLEGVQKGGQSAAQVMSTWQTVFRGIQVAQTSVAQGQPDAEADAERVASFTPDTLVRIPVDQQQQQSVEQGEQDDTVRGD